MRIGHHIRTSLALGLLLLLLAGGCGGQPTGRGAAPATATLPPLVAAAQPRTGGADLAVAYVLDASAAMQAPFGNATRLEAARRLLTAHAQAQPADARLALWAFGHRQRPADRVASCADVERVVPLLPGQAATIAGRLAALQAQGLAPLTAALEAALLDLRAAKADRKHVVLVAGGGDGCGRDPCAAVQALAAADSKLKVHVLALAADPVATASLRCITQATGGQFYLATDQAGLAQAAAVAATAVAVAPTPSPTATSRPTGGAGPTGTPTASTPLPTAPSNATALPTAASPQPSSAAPTARTPGATVAPTVTASATPSAAGPPPPTAAPPTSPEQPTATPFVEARQAVNVRAGPGLVYPVIGRLPAGASVTPLASTMNPDEDRLWLLVCCLADGRAGWVAAELVTKAPLDLPTPATVPPTPTPSPTPAATATPLPQPTAPPPTAPPPPSPEPPGKPPVPTPVP